MPRGQRPLRNDINRRLGEALRQRRRAMGWSQVRLADHLGVQGETISRIERGLQMPSMHKLADICLTLRLPLSRLVAEAEGTDGKMSSRDASGPLREILADLSADEREFVLEVASRCAKLLRARRAV